MAEKSIQFSDLTLEKIVFEFGYPQALLIWDRHGAVWQTISRVRPNLRLLQATPGRMAFHVDDIYEANVELEQARVFAHAPAKKLADFYELSATVFESVVEILEVNSLIRVGTRFLFVKEYESREAASEALYSTGLLKIPEAPQFGVNGDKKDPLFGIRYEDDKKGVFIGARVEKQRIEFKPPPSIKEPQAFQKEVDRFVFDVDLYTSVALDVGQFNTKEWLTEAEHVVRRDADVFLRSR